MENVCKLIIFLGCR